MPSFVPLGSAPPKASNFRNSLGVNLHGWPTGPSSGGAFLGGPQLRSHRPSERSTFFCPAFFTARLTLAFTLAFDFPVFFAS